MIFTTCSLPFWSRLRHLERAPRATAPLRRQAPFGMRPASLLSVNARKSRANLGSYLNESADSRQIPFAGHVVRRGSAGDELGPWLLGRQAASTSHCETSVMPGVYSVPSGHWIWIARSPRRRSSSSYTNPRDVTRRIPAGHDRTTPVSGRTAPPTSPPRRSTSPGRASPRTRSRSKPVVDVRLGVAARTGGRVVTVAADAWRQGRALV